MRLQMLIGLPGTGKSTYTNHMLKFHSRFSWQLVSPDEFIENLAKRNKRTYNEMFNAHWDEAVEYSKRMFKRFVDYKYSIILDDALMTLSAEDRKFWLDQVPDTCYVTGVVFPIPKDHRERLKSREPHKVLPEDTLINMTERFQFPDKKEGFHEIIERNFKFHNDPVDSAD